MTSQSLHHRHRGFTLIELVIVLVVVAVLSALAVPTFQTIVLNSRQETTRLTAVAVSDAVWNLALAESSSGAVSARARFGSKGC